MKIENNMIVEATEAELFCEWLKREFDDIMSFSQYKASMQRTGVKIIEDK